MVIMLKIWEETVSGCKLKTGVCFANQDKIYSYGATRY